MLWAQIVVLVISLIGTGYKIANIDKPREPYTGSDIVAEIISYALLVFAGTFSLILGWPN